ncbi:hypothetical protein AQUCO_03800184v1 [Aquilegia coerulea]|uniref:Uncharacterized protein n=1 Tax=Aquilegia coerulea TaxID=218851 RepID=A0A2G5CSY3_AQUCA|nr:hypothetical protein AQUCO_03800184v1 [Aquilegia coerulea]
MSYFGRVWIPASMVIVQGCSDQGYKWSNKLRSFQLSKERFSSSFNGFRLSEFGNDKMKQADESIQKVMYLSCWGQS